MTLTSDVMTRLVARLNTGEKCRRCLPVEWGGRPMRARYIAQVMVDDQMYLLPLCNRHNEEFDQTLSGWLQTAEVTAPPWVDPPHTDDASPPALRPAASLKALPPQRHVSFEGIQRGTVVDHDAAAAQERVDNAARAAAARAAAVNDPEALVFDGERYYLTTHARERMQERNVTLRTISALLKSKPITRPGEREHTKVLVNNVYKVVIDTEYHTIITVARRNEDERYVYAHAG